MNTMEQHIILYSKGWYKESGNVLEDLASIMINCGILTMSNAEKLAKTTVVVQTVSDIMFKIFQKNGGPNPGQLKELYHEVWRSGVFGFKESITKAEMVESMLTVIRMTSEEDTGPLNAPDPAIRELAHENTMERWNLIKKVQF